MPDMDCYRDIGALGARMDEIEKARTVRDAGMEARFEARFEAIEKKLDGLTTERNMLTGVIWAFRILFWGGGSLAVYVMTNGVPSWIKRVLQ